MLSSVLSFSHVDRWNYIALIYYLFFDYPTGALMCARCTLLNDQLSVRTIPGEVQQRAMFNL